MLGGRGAGGGAGAACLVMPATLRLVRRYKFSQLHISQFYPRPGTPAAKMRRVATHVVKERTRDLTAVFNSYSTLGPLVGTQQRVLATDLASDKKHLVAHTKGYVQVRRRGTALHPSGGRLHHRRQR